MRRVHRTAALGFAACMLCVLLCRGGGTTPADSHAHSLSNLFMGMPWGKDGLGRKPKGGTIQIVEVSGEPYTHIGKVKMHCGGIDEPTNYHAQFLHIDGRWKLIRLVCAKRRHSPDDRVWQIWERAANAG